MRERDRKTERDRETDHNEGGGGGAKKEMLKCGENFKSNRRQSLVKAIMSGLCRERACECKRETGGGGGGGMCQWKRMARKM